MIKRVVIVMSMSMAGCVTRPGVASSTQAASVVPVPQATCARAPLEFGAMPDDGIDDRAQLQAWLTSCSGMQATLPAGTWDVVTPPYPRKTFMLVLPPSTRLEGTGDTTTLRFSGDNMRGDWWGLTPAGGGSSVWRVRLVTDFAPGTTAEQTHVVRVNGPLVGFRMSHFTCDHLPEGSKSGDCVQIVGYLPDRQVSSIEIDHGRFLRSGRSGIAFHSGFCRSRFHDNEFVDVSDQDIDGEGSGGVCDLEIDHNVHRAPSTPGSSLAVQIQSATRVWMHDNELHRGVDLYGCDACRLDHNVIRLSLPGVPVATLRKSGVGTSFSDERYERLRSAGTLPVVSISHKVGAPRDVSIMDSVLVQHADQVALSLVGIAGVRVHDVSITYDGAAGGKIDAITVVGSGSSTGAVCDGVAGIRSTGVSLSDVTVTGPYRATVGLSGSYCGVGSFSLRRVRSVGASQGLRCEGVSSGSGILGPAIHDGNVMAASTCPGL